MSVAEDWPFPWPKPISHYDDAGPRQATVVHLGRSSFQVEPTGHYGLTSGRTRYYVECLTCRKVLHDRTTGPASYIRYHLEECGQEKEIR